jgi:hypothetical protein
MRKTAMPWTVAVLFGSVILGLAQAGDVNMGTWKLDEAKSKIAGGTTKNTSVVYAAEGKNVKITVDGVDAAGKPVHSEWTGMFDGKDYPVTGDPLADARGYKRVSDHALAMTAKKDGKVSLTANIVVSPDGKSRTVTSSSTDAAGKKITSIAVYSKQ